MSKRGIWISPNDFVSFQEGALNRNSLSNIIASRERSIDFTSAFSMFLPDPDPVLKKLGKDLKVYKELLGDAHVGAVVDSRKSGVLSLEWEIDRGKTKSRQAKLITEFFDTLDIYKIIREILDAPLFGYKPLEVIWAKSGNYILPSKIVGKPTEWFHFSGDNELLFRTRNNWNGEPLPPMKFLLAQNDATYENPYGKRVLSRCFWPVTFKRGGYKFWAVFLEKYGMPFFVGKHPRGNDDAQIDKLLDMLENMIQDAVAAIPDDSSVEIIESSGKSQSSQVYEKFMNFNNMEISKAILGQTLTTQMQDSGSYAASETHMQVRRDIVDSDKKIVEEVFNSLIKWIFELNFGTQGDIPKFVMYEEEDVDKTLADRDEVLTKTGVKFTKKYFIKNYGFEEEDFDITDPTEPPPGNFQESDTTGSASQDLLEEFKNNIESDSKELQAQAEAMIDVIMDLANRTATFQDFKEKAAELYPEMDIDSLIGQMEKAQFISQTWGRMNAEEG